MALAVTLLAPWVPACGRDDQVAGQPPAGAPAPPEAAAAEQRAASGRLRIVGTAFRQGDSRFDWRGITAFRLAEMLAHDREREAVAFLDWAAAQQLTVVRVLLMAKNLFSLEPADGIRALPRLLALAGTRGIHVEVVTLADTAHIAVDLEQHVKAAGAIAAGHANALVEIANEPWHASQDTRLHDPVYVKRLAELVPPGVPVALGSAETDARYAAGGYATWHSPRSTGNDGWGHVLALAEGAALLREWGKPLVSDEPIGAASALVSGRRDNAPGRFAAAAALTRLAGLQATFHYEGGLQGRIPAGTELECFTAWAAGLDWMKDLPDGGTFLPSEELPRYAHLEGHRAAFGRVFDDTLWIVGVDPTGAASAKPADGWQLLDTRPGRGLQGYRIRRR